MKANKDTIIIDNISISPDMEIEPEKLEVLLPKAKEYEEGFLRILLKTKFEKDASSIFHEIQKIKFGNTRAINEEIRERRLGDLQNMLDIANLLYVLKTDKNGIYISSAKSKCLLSTDIKKDLEDKIEKTYRTLGLDLEPMSYEEAEDILTCEFYNPQFDEEGPVGATSWIMDKCGLASDDEFTEYCYLGEPYEDLIKEYAEEHFTPCNEITPEQIKKQITELEELKNKNQKKGRPFENVKSYAVLLTFIKYGLKGEFNEFKIVYDCLVYCGLISDENKIALAEQPKKQKDYIRSLYRRCTKYRLNTTEDHLPF